jgi:hypothetical protein
MNNVGDLPAEIKAYYSLDSASSEIKIQDLNGKQLGILTFNSFEKQDDDAFILINSKTHLIEGLDENKQKTGHLYNKFINTGDFFEAPLGRTRFISDATFDKVEYTPLYY